MSYHSQIFWRYSWGVCILVQNDFRFCLCLSFVVGGTCDGAQVFGTDFVNSVSDDDCLLQDLAVSLKKKAFVPSSLDV